MLLTGWTKEISRAECRPEAQTVHCIARLNEDVGPAIPYLNAVLGGFLCSENPPSVTFRSQGKLISVHPDHIAINANRDAEEAEKILQWMQREINEAWDKRDTITPSFKAAPRPQVMAILRLLPKSNCQKCGQPTCMVFASQAAEGTCGAEHCPELSAENRDKLSRYLAGFSFD